MTTPRYSPEMRLDVAGRPAPAALREAVVQVSCETGIGGEADRLELALANEGLRWLDHRLFALDTPVVLALGYVPREPQVLFSGQVTGTEAEFPADGVPVLRVTAQDRRTRLADASPARWFAAPLPKLGALPVPDVLVAPYLALEHGLVPSMDRLGAVLSAALTAADVAGSAEDPSMRQRVVRHQHSKNTLDFLKGIAAENGWDLVMEHDVDPRGFVLRLMSPEAHLRPDAVLRYGESLAEFSPRVSSVGQVAKISLRVWRPEVRLELTVSVGYDWDRQTLSIEVAPGFGLPGGLPGTSFLIADEPVTLSSAPRLLVAKLLPMLNRRTTAKGSCPGDPRVRAGRVLRVEGVGETFGGLWRVAAAQHVLDADGYRTSFDLRKEIWFDAIPKTAQGAVRIQGGLLRPSSSASPA
ncbi:phage late control D family protein [Streptomyces sp. NPDC085529]|uniref:phage late control D family protein n=1 Tax=Streptomyces sp. NPDC085529 TaxID=3365729 RepID=UPI0037D36EA2